MVWRSPARSIQLIRRIPRGPGWHRSASCSLKDSANRRLELRAVGESCQPTVGVEYSRKNKGDEAPRKVQQEFGRGESVPSCKECQVLTPEMLCDNSKECA